VDRFAGNELGRQIFNHKYAHAGCETWDRLCEVLILRVCGKYLDRTTMDYLIKSMKEMKWIPGGRYLYYANRPRPFFNNCYLLAALEDTREDWAELSKKVELCLLSGGGVGVDYSKYRPKNSPIYSTGGKAGGAIEKAKSINNMSKPISQGGSRRCALYGSLNWLHGDIEEFLVSKNWDDMEICDGVTYGDVKRMNFNADAPLDCTNISVNYDDQWLKEKDRHLHLIFLKNVLQAMKTGEPGFSFNFGIYGDMTLANACTEVRSEDDSDVCNLASLNMARIDTLHEWQQLTEAVTKFLVCGTLTAELPYEKVYKVREKNRRLGLGFMGLHEWLIKKELSYQYEGHPCQFGSELGTWMEDYVWVSKKTAKDLCDYLGISTPASTNSIAPTGSIAMLAGTTSGIEPIYAHAYRRRHLEGSEWKEDVVIDSITERLYREGHDINDIETAFDLSYDIETRIAMQASIQDHIGGQGISSTVNLPKWGSESNNIDCLESTARIISEYAPRLRGLTFYPDGARGGQPLVPMDFDEAIKAKETKKVFHDVCTIANKGSCEV
jgi:ribonucleoside-diphosphate reductase alpha chain